MKKLAALLVAGVLLSPLFAQTTPAPAPAAAPAAKAPAAKKPMKKKAFKPAKKIGNNQGTKTPVTPP